MQISQGCNCVCSYCIVPSTRGREESRRPGELLAEVEALAADGVREVTLLGQNVNSYGRDLPRRASGSTFAELLREVDAVDGIERIRYTSPHPKDMKEDVIRAHAELPARLRAHPPAAAVGLEPDPQGDAPHLQPRALPRPRRADPRARARLRADDRHHRRLPGRDRGGLRGDARGRRGGRLRRRLHVRLLAAPRHRGRRRSTARSRTRSRASGWSGSSRSCSGAPASARSGSSAGRWRSSSRAPSRTDPSRGCAAAPATTRRSTSTAPPRPASSSRSRSPRRRRRRCSGHERPAQPRRLRPARRGGPRDLRPDRRSARPAVAIERRGPAARARRGPGGRLLRRDPGLPRARDPERRRDAAEQAAARAPAGRRGRRRRRGVQRRPLREPRPCRDRPPARRGRRPIVVGGTGLYMRAALAELELRPPVPSAVRAEVEAEIESRGAATLHGELEPRARLRRPPQRPQADRPAHRAARGCGIDPPSASDGLWSEQLRVPTALVGLTIDREELRAGSTPASRRWSRPAPVEEVRAADRGRRLAHRARRARLRGAARRRRRGDEARPVALRAPSADLDAADGGCRADRPRRAQRRRRRRRDRRGPRREAIGVRRCGSRSGRRSATTTSSSRPARSRGS